MTDIEFAMSSITSLMKEVDQMKERIEKLERLVINARVGLNVPLGGIVDEYGPIARRKING